VKAAGNAQLEPSEGATQMKGEALDRENVLRPGVDGNIGDRVFNGLTSKPPPFSVDEK